MTHERKNIHIKNLLLDTHNFRTGDTNSQEHAISEIVREQGKKLKDLALHIAENGLSPNYSLSVVPDSNEDGKYVVIDGNRRATAIKLIIRPSLAPDSLSKNRFTILHNHYAEQIQKKIPCAVMNLEEAKKWRRIEHYRDQVGVQQEAWTAMAKARADQEEGNPSLGILCLDLALSSDFLADDVMPIANSGEFHLTILERILNPQTQQALGVKLDNGKIVFDKPTVWVSKIISKMVAIIIRKEFEGFPFSSTNINTKEEIEIFVKKIIDEIGESPKKEIDEYDLPDEDLPVKTPESSEPYEPYIPPQTWRRSFLIPASHTSPTFESNKLGKLYKELKTRIATHNREVAVSMLFRALLELSLAHYCKKNRIKKLEIIDPKNQTKKTKKIKSTEDRAFGAIKHMENNDKAEIDDLIMFRKLFERDSSFIKEFHIYVHNQKIIPIKRDLHESWDKVASFFDVLWEDKL